jgi:hypothetical protein
MSKAPGDNLEAREMCICCKKLPAVPAIVVELIREAIGNPGRDMRAGFCKKCAVSGCDGINPCKARPIAIDAAANSPRSREAWSRATELHLGWLSSYVGPDASAGEHDFAHDTAFLRDAKEWRNLSDGYWAKARLSEMGVVLLEVLVIPGLPGFEARAHILHPGYLRTRRIAEAWLRYGPATFQQAEAACDALFHELVQGQGRVSTGDKIEGSRN